MTASQEIDKNLERPLTDWERDQIVLLANGLEPVGDGGELHATLVRRLLWNAAELERIVSDFRGGMKLVPPASVGASARVNLKQALMASDVYFPGESMVGGYETQKDLSQHADPSQTQANLVTREEVADRREADEEAQNPKGPKLLIPGVDD